MIQRIQSIFLFLSSVGFLSLFKLPFATSDKSIPNLLGDMVYNVQDHIILIILSILGGVLALAAIFLYKNRDLQLKLSNFTIICSVLLPLVAILLIYNEGTATNPSANIEDGLGIYASLASLVFAILASRFIKKDDQLVKSMDRLR